MAFVLRTLALRRAVPLTRSHYNRVNPFKDIMQLPKNFQKIERTPEELFVQKLGSPSAPILGALPMMRNKYGNMEPYKPPERTPKTAHKFVFMRDDKIDDYIEKVASKLEVGSRVPVMKLPASEELGFDAAAANRRFRFVFTDIGKGTDETRTIVIRETNGVLRTASPDERDTLNHKYFPKEKKLAKPIPAFEDKYLKVILGDVRHAEVLDFITTHRQPHQSDYIRVHRRVYEDVDARQSYGLLQGTKHWANFVQFLLNEGQINGLLTSILSSNRLDDAISLVEFYNARFAKTTNAKHLTGVAALKEYVNRGPTHRRQAEHFNRIMNEQGVAATAQA